MAAGHRARRPATFQWKGESVDIIDYGPMATIQIGKNAWEDACETWADGDHVHAADPSIEVRREGATYVIKLPLLLAEDLMEHCAYTAWCTDADANLRKCYGRASETIKLQLFAQTGKTYPNLRRKWQVA